VRDEDRDRTPGRFSVRTTYPLLVRRLPRGPARRRIIRTFDVGRIRERAMGVGSFFDYPGQAGTPEAPAEDAVFLPDLDEEGWERLIAYTQSRRFARGEIVIPAGSRDRSLLIVADGTIEAAGAGGPAVLQTGAVLGELAFFDGQPLDAPVRALTDVDMLVLSQESFEILAAHEPALARAVIMDLGRIVALRLRRSMVS